MTVFLENLYKKKNLNHQSRVNSDTKIVLSIKLLKNEDIKFIVIWDNEILVICECFVNIIFLFLNNNFNIQK